MDSLLESLEKLKRNRANKEQRWRMKRPKGSRAAEERRGSSEDGSEDDCGGGGPLGDAGDDGWAVTTGGDLGWWGGGWNGGNDHGEGVSGQSLGYMVGFGNLVPFFFTGRLSRTNIFTRSSPEHFQNTLTVLPILSFGDHQCMLSCARSRFHFLLCS